MSTKYPKVTGKKVLRVLKKLGIDIIRQKGSHVIVRNSCGKVSVVLIHAGKIIEPGLLRSILRDLEIGLEDFLKFL